MSVVEVKEELEEPLEMDQQPNWGGSFMTEDGFFQGEDIIVKPELPLMEEFLEGYGPPMDNLYMSSPPLLGSSSTNGDDAAPDTGHQRYFTDSGCGPGVDMDSDPETCSPNSHYASTLGVGFADIDNNFTLRCSSIDLDPLSLNDFPEIESRPHFPRAQSDRSVRTSSNQSLDYEDARTNIILNRLPHTTSLIPQGPVKKSLLHKTQNLYKKKYKCYLCNSRFHSSDLMRSHYHSQHYRNLQARKATGKAPVMASSPFVLKKLTSKRKKVPNKACSKTEDSEHKRSIKDDRKYTLLVKKRRTFPQAEEAKFQCELCPKKFFIHHRYEHLYWTHMQYNRFKCPLCSYKHYYKTRINAHYKSHHALVEQEPEDITTLYKHDCNLCNAQFFTTTDLENHTNTYHKTSWTHDLLMQPQVSSFSNITVTLPRPMNITDFETKSSQCGEKETEGAKESEISAEAPQLCKSDFDIQRLIRSQLIRKVITSGQGYYECLHCGQPISHNKIEEHIYWHHMGIVRYQCGLCKYKHYSASRIRTHWVRVHRNQMSPKVVDISHRSSFKCSQCDARFTVHSKLSTHTNVFHTGQEKCGVMDAAPDVSQSPEMDQTSGEMLERKELTTSKLAPSIEVNQRNKNFRCCICPKSYRRDDHLIAHVYWSHMHVVRFKCVYCSYAHFYRSQVRYHCAQRHHNQTFYVTDIGALSTHVCNICGAMYPSETLLESHIAQFHTNSQTSEVFQEFYASLRVPMPLSYGPRQDELKIYFFNSRVNVSCCELVISPDNAGRIARTTECSYPSYLPETPSGCKPCSVIIHRVNNKQTSPCQ